MALEGRIEGRVSADGQFYELVQNGVVKQSIPIADAHANTRFMATIKQNGWEKLP